MDLKHRLLKKNRKVAKTVTLTHEGGTTEVQIIKPTNGDRMAVLEAATLRKELDAENKPTSPMNGVRLGARMIQALVFHEGQPIWGEDDIESICAADFYDTLLADVSPVFQGESMESAKGESDAPAPSGASEPSSL